MAKTNFTPVSGLTCHHQHTHFPGPGLKPAKTLPSSLVLHHLRRQPKQLALQLTCPACLWQQRPWLQTCVQPPHLELPAAPQPTAQHSLTLCVCFTAHSQAKQLTASCTYATDNKDLSMTRNPADDASSSSAAFAAWCTSITMAGSRTTQASSTHAVTGFGLHRRKQAGA